MDTNSKIFVAGHNGLVGSSITGILREKGYKQVILKDKSDLDLIDHNAVEAFFRKEKPEYVFLAAAKVGGIQANNTLRADFIYQNLAIQNNVIFSSWKYNVKKLLFLGSTCIYPKTAPQPLRETYLLTSPLEYTNEPYAIAKIAGLKLCESFNIQYGTEFISVMPSNLYGIRDNFDLEKGHVLPSLLRKFILARYLEQRAWEKIKDDLERISMPSQEIQSPVEILTLLERHGIYLDKYKNAVRIELWGTGLPLREFMYADDLARFCISILKEVSLKEILDIHKKSQPDIINPPHFLNIGTGHEITIKDLSEKIRIITEFSGEVVFDKTKPDGTFRKITDNTAIRALGFSDFTSLDEGLNRVYKSYIGS